MPQPVSFCFSFCICICVCFFGFGSFDGTGPWSGPKGQSGAAKICYLRSFVTIFDVDVDSSATTDGRMNSRRVETENDDSKTSSFPWSDVSISFVQRTAETQHGQVGQQRFKINEVSRLSGHTFSCPGTGMGCRPQGPGPRICCLSCSLCLSAPRSPTLSDCNLLFRFICQNIFPVPLFR